MNKNKFCARCGKETKNKKFCSLSCSVSFNNRNRLKSNLIGKKFGKLLVIERANKPDHIKSNKIYCLCECDCGRKKIIRYSDLKNGHTKSCGCYQEEIINKRIGKDAKNRVFSNYKGDSKRKKRNFSLSKEKFFEIIEKRCFYCGVEPSNKEKGRYNNGEYVYNGIDRIDNTIGYIEGNVVPCCWKCNQAKRSMDITVFYEWSDRLYEYRHKIRNS